MRISYLVHRGQISSVVKEKAHSHQTGCKVAPAAQCGCSGGAATCSGGVVFQSFEVSLQKRTRNRASSKTTTLPPCLTVRSATATLSLLALTRGCCHRTVDSMSPASSTPSTSSLLQKLLVALEQQLIPLCLSGAAVVATYPMLSAAVVVLLYLPLSACACLGSLYVPALVLILWVSGCRALVVDLVGTKHDSFLILAQI